MAFSVQNGLPFVVSSTGYPGHKIQNPAHLADSAETGVKMNDLTKTVAQIGRKWAANLTIRGQGTLKNLTQIAGPIIADRPLKLVGFKGPWGARFLPIFHAPETKQLLMWSDKMGVVVDLAQIKPGTVQYPVCYESMFGLIKNQKIEATVRKFCVGAFDQDDIEAVADFCYGLKSKYIFNDPIPTTIVCETIARNYPQAIYESGTGNS